MINPIRENFQFLVYTEDEGGDFKFLDDFTKEDWEKLEERGWFEFRMGDAITRIYPAFAALSVTLDNHDFRIDEINGTRKEIKPGNRVRFTPAVRRQRVR